MDHRQPTGKRSGARGVVGGQGCAQAVRLLLDEMFSPVVAAELRKRGHDVVATAEDPAWRSLGDPEVLSLAVSQQRAVVTNNLRDFRPLHTDTLAGGGQHYGMVFVPTTVPRTKRAIGALVAGLELRSSRCGMVFTTSS